MWDIVRETYYIMLPIVTTAFMGLISTRLKEQDKQRKLDAQQQMDMLVANSAANRTILKYMLERYHTEYMHKGSVTEKQYEAACSVYDSYHNLGGNGFGTDLWNDIQSLPKRTDVSESVSPFADMLMHEYDKHKGGIV